MIDQAEILMLERVISILKDVKQKDIHFKKDFHKRAIERPIIAEKLVRKYLKQPNKLLNVKRLPDERIGEQKYKLEFKLSRKYKLIVVVARAKRLLYIYNYILE